MVRMVEAHLARRRGLGVKGEMDALLRRLGADACSEMSGRLWHCDLHLY